MAYVIAEPCIGTKDNSCTEVCPVDCIHPTPDEPDYDQVARSYGGFEPYVRTGNRSVTYCPGGMRAAAIGIEA